MGGNSTSSTGHSKASVTATLRTDSFTVRIPKGMAGEAAAAAKSLGISRAQLVKRAVADMLDDIRDMKIIDERRKEPSIPHDEFWKKVGLEG